MAQQFLPLLPSFLPLKEGEIKVMIEGTVLWKGWLSPAVSGGQIGPLKTNHVQVIMWQQFQILHVLDVCFTCK